MKKYLLGLALVLSLTGCATAPEAPEESVSLYYYNADQDKDAEGNILCSEQGLVAVERPMPSEPVIENTLQMLLAGDLTEEEEAAGISTEYPLEGLELAGVNLVDGLLTLNFDDPNNKTSGGSCRVSILWQQIEKTAQQFAEVEEVRFSPEWLFQP